MIKDEINFNYKDCIIAGDACYLITPKEFGCEWTKDNLPYRSVIVRASDGWPVSVSHFKFFNYGEKSDLYPDPAQFDNWHISEKLDGSTCIISKYKNEVVVRTRGTTDAFQHESANELKGLLIDNPKIIDNQWVCSENYSLIFEHLSLINPIVIRYSQPKLVLVGIICHDSMTYLSHSMVDYIAGKIGVDRPEVYQFNSISEIVENCKVLKGMEGYVLTYGEVATHRIKLKGAEYLFLHKAKSQINSFDKVLDLFFAWGCPAYQDFRDKLESAFDFELAQMADENIKDVTRYFAEVSATVEKIREKVLTMQGIPRKDAALEIKRLYEGEGLTGFAFTLLNGKAIDDRDLAKRIIERYKTNK